MLEKLRDLFSSRAVAYADPKATIPLGAVLKHDWFELWYQPKIELKTTCGSATARKLHLNIHPKSQSS